MKCPQCSEKTPDKENRTSCPKCAYRFAFRPGDRMKDTWFLAIVRRASQNDTVYFTEHQLYTAYAQWSRNVKRSFPFITLFLGFVAVMGGLILEISPFYTVPAAVAAVGLMFLLKRNSGPPLTYPEFQRLVRQWLGADKPIKRLIIAGHPRLAKAPPRSVETDLYNYGVERILIVERDELVDLLVLNDFAARERALILSQNGYPAYLEDRLRDILESQPGVPIFVLHDATPKGMNMAELLSARLPQLSAHRDRIVDLGITVEDVRKIPALKKCRSIYGTERLPVDVLPAGILASLAAAAMLHSQTLAYAAAQQQASGDGGGGSYG